MLVLGRKVNEEIVIIDSGSGTVIAVVTVTKIKGGKVRLGIEAPKNIKIMRGELAAHEIPNK